MTEEQIEALEDFVVAVVKAHTEEPCRGYFRELSVLKKAFDEAQKCCESDNDQLHQLQLQSAFEAAARADAKAEDLYAKLVEAYSWSGRHLGKLCNAKQTIQAQQNTIDCRDEDEARLRSELDTACRRIEDLERRNDNHLSKIDALEDEVEALTSDNKHLRERCAVLERCNENQRKLIQTLRGASGAALIQRMRDDMAAVEHLQSSVSFEHLRGILEAYERQGLS